MTSRRPLRAPDRNPERNLFLRCAIASLGLAAAACAAPTASSSPESGESVVAADLRAHPAGVAVPSDVAWLSPAAGNSDVLLLTALGEGGLAWFDLGGQELGRDQRFEATLVETLDGHPLGGTPRTTDGQALVAVADARASAIRLVTVDPIAGRLVDTALPAIEVGDEITGLCHGYSTLSQEWLLFAATDSGAVRQWSLDPSGEAPARELRTLYAGKGAGHCAVDPVNRTLYLVQESLGIWTTGSEPESDPAFSFLALPEPHGPISDDLKGLALLGGGEDEGLLLVSDVANGQLRMISTDSGTQLAALRVEGLGEGEGLAVASLDGALHLAIADEDESPGARAAVVLNGASLLGALGLDTTPSRPMLNSGTPAVVHPVVETDVVDSWGDAADDPAIWVHPTDPARSLVLGSQKKGGIHVYDLQGRERQFLEAGRINNVDLRDGFPLGGREVTLVAGSDRTRDGVALFLLDGEAGRLSALPGSFVPTDLTDPYGLCLYRSARDGSFQVIVNDSVDGRAVQFRLQDDGAGGISHERLRDIHVGSQAEGCVADDETGALFIAEEGHGIWKYPAEAADGEERILVDGPEGGRVVPDVEGVALWKGPGDSGYLVVSNQGNDSYLLYRRNGDHAYVGEFFIVAGENGDGASETDGLEVTSAPLGAAFPDGLLVVQDGRNLAPAAPQNFKLVSWRDIAEALSLD